MWKTFSTVFVSVFIAEIGDKTQLATMLFSAEQPNRWVVFAGSAGALVCASAIGVIAGAEIQRFVRPHTLRIVAGIGFIAIGAWTLVTR